MARRSRSHPVKSRRGLDAVARHDIVTAVMNAPVQIRKAETVERLRRLATLEGKSITELVDEMVRERDERLVADREAEIRGKIAAANETVRRFQALPIIGRMPTDDDLYDEDGLPK